MWLTITTVTGKKFAAHRCYISAVDGVLNIGLVDTSMYDAVSIFGQDEETETIVCYNPETDEETQYTGYTYLSLATVDDSGVYIVLRKP